MPQILVIFGPDTQMLFVENQAEGLARSFVPIVERVFGIGGKNDVAVTGTKAAFTIGEADVQVEVKYTVGEDEYGQGKIFDPTPVQRATLAELIRHEFGLFLAQHSSKKYSLSVLVLPMKECHFALFKDGEEPKEQ